MKFPEALDMHKFGTVTSWKTRHSKNINATRSLQPLRLRCHCSRLSKSRKVEVMINYCVSDNEGASECQPSEDLPSHSVPLSWPSTASEPGRNCGDNGGE